MAQTQRKAKRMKSTLSVDQGKASPLAASGMKPDARLKLVICLLLIIITVAAYWQVWAGGFIECFDDQDYVSKNPIVSGGLTGEGLRWAFKTFTCANWHPVTWLSHMADCGIYGLDPRGHHITSLLFHIGNALILFLLMTSMTREIWKSGFVAALFAVHPMHVESVAWVAERKDVLSTLFWLLTSYAYVLYVRRPSLLRYIPVMVAFALGLMSKPMLVSLPLVLLLLDYWPLRRLDLRWRLLWEKIPLFAVSAASCIVTVVAQKSGGAVADLESYAVGLRIENAAVSYITYIAKAIWPSNLAVLYPLDSALPVSKAILAALALVVATIMFARMRRDRPYLSVGWLWYLVTLAPVIGLVQVGSQAMADRYSYITFTGLFIIVAWGIPDLLRRRGMDAGRMLPALAAILIVSLAVCTHAQVGLWRDSYTLFDHAVKVTRDNGLAHNDRGMALVQQGRRQEAIPDFQLAVELKPSCAQAHNNLGLALIDEGRCEEGTDQIRTALRLGLDTAEVHYGIALGSFRQGKPDIAAEECRISLKLDSKSAPAQNLMGTILGRLGRMDECIQYLKVAAALDPAYPDPHANLAVAYFAKQDYASAWREVRLAEARGGQTNPQFLQALSSRMPEPGS